MINGVSFSVLSTIYMFLLIIIFFRKKHIQSTELKIFSILLVTNLIGLIIEVILSFFAIFTTEDSIFLNIIAKAFLLYYIIFTSFFIMYILQVLDAERYKKYKKNYFFVLLLGIVITSILIFIQPIYLNHGSKPYSYGPAVNTLYFFASITITISVILLVFHITKIKNKKYIPLIFYIIGTIIVAIIQKLNPSLTLSTSIDSLLLFIMYFTIENPDIKMLEQVSIAKENAEKANHAKTDFLSNMSHEIRTPLNAIVGFSESLKEEELLDSAKEKVNDIIMASDSLLEIVNGILDISKIEANKLEIINKEYDTELMFNDLVALTRARIGEKGLDFRVKIDESIPRILYGDSARLKQIYLNILTNAVKYTNEGYIEFVVSSVIKDNVCRLIVSVEDSGIGIKKDNLDKLFNKFERLDVEKQATIEGTGLGLAITKKLVELMNGKIVVQSIYGEGSKFTISIDQRIVAVEPQLIKETEKSNSKIIDVSGSNILLVDDNALNIKVASTLLKKYRFNIDSCVSGYECIEKVKENNYDIIFLDDMMPKLSGKDTLKILKEDKNFKTPVIALTANAITGMKEEYLECGFDDYLSKPIEKNELERVIRTYLQNVNKKEINSNLSSSMTSIIEDKLNNVEQKKKVLLIEDNKELLSLEENILKELNLDVTEVDNSSDAIAKVIDNKYDMILINENISSSSAYDTLDNFQMIDGFDMPVVLITDSKSKGNSGIRKGFTKYLIKPIDEDKVKKIIGNLLN